MPFVRNAVDATASWRPLGFLRFVGSVFLFVVIWFAAPKVASAIIRLEDEKEIVVVLDSHMDGTILKEIDIGELVRGVSPTFRFRFVNRLSEDLRFAHIKVECSCTSARIPNEVISSGAELIGEVDFVVGKQERSLSKTFGLEISTKGGADRVLLRLKGRIKNVIAFPRDFFSVSVNEGDLKEGSKVVWSSPLVVSDDVNLDKIRISAKGELASKVTVSLDALGEPKARLEIKTKDLPLSGSANIDIVLEGGGVPPQTACVSFLIRQNVTLLPSVLFFSSTDIDHVEASGLVRVANKSGNVDLLLTRVVLESGEEIKGNLFSVGNGVWRLELVASKELLSAVRGKVREITVFMLLDQKPVELKARSSFKW
jgi:hypothetical protein